MSLSKNFDFVAAEEKWYSYWMESGYFHSQPNEKPSFTIVMPPPNVTGVLHMGHALNNTVQDILIRRAKNQGFNTCWVPGTDHASIATEAKVVNMLKEKGIDKNKLSRPEFLSHAWEWKEEYGGIILEQLKKLGCSLDWDRTHFTMDEDYYNTVIKVFVDLYKKGKIYRGVKMINWDPQALTALSDEEVIFKETNSQLTYIKYKIVESDDEYITIATVRPETIMGDTAICVHPDDPKYAHLKGKHAIVPLINREVPIIFDEYIDMEFGTGALKVTPAHDINDYNLGQKHNLQVIDTINDNGTMSNAAQIYIGEDRFTVRKKIISDLAASGNLVKQEEYRNQVGVSERTGAVVEPKLSMQWWCDMESMAQPALAAVMNEEIEFFPSKFKNLYRHWMGNIKDWCISRQLWWGQRIPAWYDEQNNIYVAENESKALEQYLKNNPQGKAEDLRQDDDVLDTWFSSWLWPLQVFEWNAEGKNAALDYYYPTNTLVTAPDIIFFWVARMVMAGYEYMGQKPFDKVYFTGLIRDKQGRKMSKQLGNSPDLLQLIQNHGADVVRFSVLISSPAGNDILYDEAFLEQGRNFTNKIWNALKLVKIWEEKIDKDQIESSFAVDWMKERIVEVKNELNGLYDEFKLSEALKTIYSLIWDDFCSWYLEWVKPAFESSISASTFNATIEIFQELMLMLHPFMPFLTEEVNYQLNSSNASLMSIEEEKNNLHPNAAILKDGMLLQQIITAVRDVRNRLQLKPKDSINLFYESQNPSFYTELSSIISKQVNAERIDRLSGNSEDLHSLVVDREKLFVESKAEIDASGQAAQLQKDLDYMKGFLNSVEKKLSNEKFVQNAKPDIVANEQKKKADAIAKIATLEESLAKLN